MSAARRPALGKGLSALIPGTDNAPGIFQRNRLPLTRIDPRPEQPRKHFDQQALESLADSIKQYGLLQPIVVRAVGNRYQIIAGERRYRACHLASLAEIDVVVRETDDETLFSLALIENIHRDDLSPLEEARAIAQMIDSLKITQAEAAKRLDISRSAVTNKLRLLTLPGEIQVAIEEGKLSEGHGRALLGAGAPEAMLALGREAVRCGWNVRDIERKVRDGSAKPKKSRNKKRPASIDILEKNLENTLGTKVRIQPTGNSRNGRLIISYFSTEDLDRVADWILRKE